MMLYKHKLFNSEGTINKHGKYLIFMLYGLSLLVFGFAVNPASTIIYGLYDIIVNPDFLITDYIGVGGLGATFVNSGLVTLMSLYILYKQNIDLTGPAVSTIWLMSGFSMFGKNIFNIWFIIIGVLIYSRYQKEKFAKYVYIAFLGSSLSPLITQIMLGTTLPIIISIPLGVFFGISIGFILPPLAASLMRVHHGYNLYNIGFTSGLVGTIFVSLLRSYGVATESRLIWTSGNNTILGVFLFIMFFSMIFIGFLLNGRSFKDWKNILNYSGKLITDFVVLQGFGTTLINMGINGIFATIYVLIVKGDLNGPSIGGIFAITGFGAFGKHIKNMTPIFLGVFIGSLTKIWSINDPPILLAALFGTTLAPIAGEFGWKYGTVAGFLLSSVVLNVGYLHAGFNLYNTGFAGGLVAAAMVPVIESIRRDEY